MARLRPGQCPLAGGRFVTSRLGDRRTACETQIVARRLAVLHQPVAADPGRGPAFYQRFLRILGQLVKDLERRTRSGARCPSSNWLMAAIALCYAGLCCEGLEKTLRRATQAPRARARRADRRWRPCRPQPRILVELLFDPRLPLRQMYASREIDTPRNLLHAIDRMLPMVLFRHRGRHSLQLGMGVTAADHLATL